MYSQIVKMYNSHDFEQITKGVKVAQSMQIKSPDKQVLTNKLTNYVASEKLCCSYCNAVFQNKVEQRLHYKLDWHRFNLKQQLEGLEPVTEQNFNLSTSKDTQSSSKSEIQFDHENQNANLVSQSNSLKVETRSHNNAELEKSETKTNDVQSKSCDENICQNANVKKDSALSSTGRQPKILFENQDGNFFGIYNCLLLHRKKLASEVDHDTIVEILTKKEESLWTIVMVGSGHFAGAVFLNGKAVIHKTLHAYTVRAKQGTAQHSRDGRRYCKSAGASLRRSNELHFAQNVQKVLKSWSPYLTNSSLILYRAVGPHNRTIFFGGKEAPLDKTDCRLRALPFPTRRPTFKEVCRVYDLLNTVEVYSSASSYANDSPVSKRASLQENKSDDSPRNDKVTNDLTNEDAVAGKLAESQPANDKKKKKNSRTQADGVKPMKSHKKLLPDIVARLAEVSLESEFSLLDNIDDIQDLIGCDTAIDLKGRLQEFENTPVPKSRSKGKKNLKSPPKTSKKD